MRATCPPPVRPEDCAVTGGTLVAIATALPQWSWQPTDADPGALPGIAAWVRQSGLANVRPPLLLDVLGPQWPAQGPAFTDQFDAIYCANMLHISPWATCAALMQGSARHLAPQGVLVTYGPYLEDDAPTAPGNLAFDQSLRARDAAWGIRHLSDVEREAQRAGLDLRERHAMPANNLLLVFSAQDR